MSLQIWQETLTSAVADGPTLTAAANASCIPTGNKITLPNNYFYIGRMLKVTAQGRISCVVTTPGTARFDVRLANVVNVDSTAMPMNTTAQTNVPWWLEIVGTCRSTGSGSLATIFWFGTFTSMAVVGSSTNGTPNTHIFTHNALNTAATAIGPGFDSTAALSVDLTFTQTVATGSLTLQEYKVESLT